ncbi:hypothetical protein [Nannocystis sp. SCPEA4]|uniref:hypothetical protein n=1 Tax=Nannocystis sp. SCPEA4 TaxID=2996787 RepID=UPI00226D72A7|nr:hypothetical protein [Nannocystis sp. SCPEA4]MCY1060603.1 hypothetical protein [Nannocystis sp. SCPEA4]
MTALACDRSGFDHAVYAMVHQFLAIALLFTHAPNSSSKGYDEELGREEIQIELTDGFSFRTGFLIEEWGAEAEVEVHVFPGRHVEVKVSTAGQPHIIIMIYGDDDKRLWVSERAEAAGLLLKSLQHIGSDEALSEVRKNPACGVFKWAVSAVLTAGVVACCTNLVACVACTLAGSDAQKKIDGIDCNKECKPECPI